MFMYCLRIVSMRLLRFLLTSLYDALYGYGYMVLFQNRLFVFQTAFSFLICSQQISTVIQMRSVSTHLCPSCWSVEKRCLTPYLEVFQVE